MAQFFFRALPVITAKDATMDFEQLTFALNNGDVEVNSKGEARLVTGPWTNPEGFSTKLEETTSVQVRTEQGKAVARLKGLFKTKEAIPGKTTLFTLPPGFRPTGEEQVTDFLDASGAKRQNIRIKTNGVVEAELEMTVAHFFSFQTMTFSLT